MPDKMLTIEDVASLFLVSDRTVKRWIDSGKLKCVKIPNGKRILEEHVKELLQQLNPGMALNA